MNKRLLTAKEVSQATGLRLSRIYFLCRNGLIPVVNVGARQYLFAESRIEQWLGIAQDSEIKEKEVKEDA